MAIDYFSRTKDSTPFKRKMRCDSLIQIPRLCTTKPILHPSISILSSPYPSSSITPFPLFRPPKYWSIPACPELCRSLPLLLFLSEAGDPFCSGESGASSCCSFFCRALLYVIVLGMISLRNSNWSILATAFAKISIRVQEERISATQSFRISKVECTEIFILDRSPSFRFCKVKPLKLDSRFKREYLFS